MQGLKSLGLKQQAHPSTILPPGQLHLLRQARLLHCSLILFLILRLRQLCSVARPNISLKNARQQLNSDLYGHMQATQNAWSKESRPPVDEADTQLLQA